MKNATVIFILCIYQILYIELTRIVLKSERINALLLVLATVSGREQR